MNHYQIIKEKFDLSVSEAEAVIKKQFELDKNARFLLGIVVTSDRDDLMYYRGSQKILINDRELFPEGYHSKLLMAGLNVAPDERMVSVGGVPTGNGKLDVWFTDVEHSEVPFAAYTVTIYAYSTPNDPSSEP